jgi:hypothetical protein
VVRSLLKPADCLDVILQHPMTVFQLPTFPVAFEQDRRRRKLESKESLVIHC